MIFHQLKKILWVCFLLAGGICTAAPGDFDSSFNRVGFTRDSIAGSTAGECVAIHPSGEVVTSGHYGNLASGALVLWRHLPDGTLDEAFGDGGVIFPPSPVDVAAADSLAIDQLDRIVLIATTSTSYVALRFNFDGSADLSFGGTGMLSIPIEGGPFPITGVAIDDENRIVGVGGSYGSRSRFIVYRVQETGELDPSFGGTGIVFTEMTAGPADRATGVALQLDGKIVVVGRGQSPLNYAVALARYLPAGVLDPDFGSEGKVVFSVLDTNLGRKVVIQPDGKIAVAFSACLNPPNAYCSPGLARLDDRGAFDPTFGDGGRTYVDLGGFGAYAYDLALQQDGAIVTVGFRSITFDTNNATALLLRFLPDGSLDDTFGLDGISETTYGYRYNIAASIRLQADGLIVIAGSTGHPLLGGAVTAGYLAK